MKKVLLLFILLMSLTQASAQFGNMPKFDPQQFQANMEQFITTEAALSPKQAEAFFPVYREMQKKQRVLFDQQRRLRHIKPTDEAGCIKPTDEAGCREAIQKSDDCELQLKEVQLQYHKKFMKILPASKVYDVLRAEEKFHRQIFGMNRFGRGGRGRMGRQ